MNVNEQNAAITEQVNGILDLIENQHRLEQAKAMLSEPQPVALHEGWGDQVDTKEYLYDTGWSSQDWGSYVPTLDDRKGGKYSPFFEDETEHAMTRGMGLVLSERYATGVNVTEALNNYTIGEGLAIEAIAPEGVDPNQQLLGIANGIIKRFMDDNDWESDLESDSHDETRTRGEAFIRMKVRGNRIRADLLEPEQVTEPGNARQLSEWAVGDILRDDFVPSWTFGVLTADHQHDEPRGYHVVYDGIGRDWDFFPSDPLPHAMACVEHVKRNTPRNVKRGLTDFYPTAGYIKSADTLLGNLGAGASVQAAIAWIVEHAPGVTENQVGSLLSGRATERVTRSSQTGSRTVNREKFRPGHVIHTPQGRKYHQGPLGQNNSPNYVLVEQAILRVAGTRWQFPEGLISGDWSNNNFASALIAEGPFVKSRERDQRYYASRFKRLFWKVLKIAYYLGWFRGASWEEIEGQIDIAVNPPPVATRNRLEMAQENAILVPLGIRSKQTASEQMGDDWNQEQERGVESATNAGLPVTGELGTLGRRQQTNAIKGADEALAAFRDGTRSEGQTVQLLQSLGMSPDRAKALVDDSRGGSESGVIVTGPRGGRYKLKPDGRKVPVSESMESVATYSDAIKVLTEGYP